MKNPFRKPKPPPMPPFVSPETARVIEGLRRGQRSVVTPMPPPKREKPGS